MGKGNNAQLLPWCYRGCTFKVLGGIVQKAVAARTDKHLAWTVREREELSTVCPAIPTGQSHPLI